ncbi:AAA family ATPase [Azospirillum halopraeferens]|uniref:bifunctional aminoglycoside phosphotransferase/ATP-binding protein n=1 Tax=Azospirillum halopraeferens TaxID=34010 RepID=UPI000410B7F1|nr:AAA family ATPase [Azospirillum halopraeferens]
MTDADSDVDAAGGQDAVIAFLEDPGTHGGQPVERIDTHGAIVFLAGDRALKLKRAVRFPYMDFSTRERRRAACEAELALNRRTAPDLYRAVEPVVRRSDGTLATGGSGAVLDWVVVMHRFDGDRLFDRMAGRGALTPDLMRHLADAIAAFHAAAPERRDAGGAAAMAAVSDGNLAELAQSPALFPPPLVDRLAAASRTALARHGALMDARRDAGRVRHCHGDLHLRNIVLHDGRPTLFDCIEFDDSLAVVDVLYDLAFLLMDLDHRGLRPLGNAVLNRYLEVTGEHGGLALLPLFLSVRAAVRAKVDAAAAAAQEDGERAAGLRADARRYLEQALASLEPPPPRLVAVGGLSGTGKTTVARGLAPAIGPAPGAVVLRSDVLRKRLHGVAETTRLPPEAYTPAATAAVYAAIADAAAAALAAGHAVVADAVYARPEERQAIAAVAAAAGVPFHGVWLEAPAPVREQRVTGRCGDASDATAEVVHRQESYDPGPLDWVPVAAGGDPAAVLDAARERLS